MNAPALAMLMLVLGAPPKVAPAKGGVTVVEKKAPQINLPPSTADEAYAQCLKVPFIDASAEKLDTDEVTRLRAANKRQAKESGIVNWAEQGGPDSSADGFRADGAFVQYLPSAKGMQLTIQPSGGCFTIVKEYFPSGAIQRKRVVMSEGHFVIGFSFEFKADGTVLKTVDNDAPFTFTFAQVIAFLKAQKIPVFLGHQQYGSRTSISRQHKPPEAPFWIIEWPRTGTEIEVIELNGMTGALVKKSTYSYGEE